MGGGPQIERFLNLYSFFHSFVLFFYQVILLFKWTLQKVDGQKWGTHPLTATPSTLRSTLSDSSLCICVHFMTSQRKFQHFSPLSCKTRTQKNFGPSSCKLRMLIATETWSHFSNYYIVLIFLRLQISMVMNIYCNIHCKWIYSLGEIVS